MKELKKYIEEMIKKHPQFKTQILDLLDLCKHEIEAGESPENEISLCWNSINKLVKEQAQ